MIEFLKERSAVSVMALAGLIVLALVAGIALPYAEARKAACAAYAQQFDPPASWRWSFWREWTDPWGDGCEIGGGGQWYPAYMIKPRLEFFSTPTP